MLWRISVTLKESIADPAGAAMLADARDLGIAGIRSIRVETIFLLECELGREQVARVAAELLADPVTETFKVSTAAESVADEPGSSCIHVFRRTGVMDPVESSVLKGIRDLGPMVTQASGVCGPGSQPGRPGHVARASRPWLFMGKMPMPLPHAARARIGRRIIVRPQLPRPVLESFVRKAVANEVVDEFFFGPFALEHLAEGRPYRFERVELPFRGASDAQLETMSRRYVLSLNVEELRAVQRHFESLGRNPTDVEVETIAQTWSEHCKHKTLTGIINYVVSGKEEHTPESPLTRGNFKEEHTPESPLTRGDFCDGREIDNLLKSTVMRATRELAKPWCISVFKDNAGIIEFDEKHAVCFKVETHNHPSAIEPYGGAGTGVGGVIRDVLGCGLGAKPVLNTDIFCFARPDFPADALPKGVLHPKRVLKGVVSGVRDYGNRMGIPTANGAVYFDDRYLANPLVYVGTIGIMPRDKCFKGAQPGDVVVVAGGRTGRDGIHGATFSSVELTTESEVVSGGAVQIGNAIAEKKVTDTLLQARDLGLYTAVTDCGAGGLSSAVGEMGAELGAEVDLEKVPLKYQGLSPVEIWISEAQERMVFAVPPDKLDALLALFKSEDVEAVALGRFTSDKKLVLRYEGKEICRLDMDFLHDGVPRFHATAVAPRAAGQNGNKDVCGMKAPCSGALHAGKMPALQAGKMPELKAGKMPALHQEWQRYDAVLIRILSDWNVCSKEWIIRQYDHEVQGGSALKPLVGVENDGPGDACIVRPLLGSNKGIAVSCGMNPQYGDIDPYLMAASAIDEAVRNVVAVGGNIDRTALLDNFCWGNTRRPEALGTLVRAALACYDIAKAFGTPFISGKDSLNNEFRVKEEGQAEKLISIPPSLLISAISVVDDVRKCVSMDLKTAGNLLYVLGKTKNELGGSQFLKMARASRPWLFMGKMPVSPAKAPSVDAAAALAIFRALGKAIQAGLVRACHDVSEGGLAVAAAEMAFAGNVGAELSRIGGIPCDFDAREDPILLFSESNSRFLVEVEGRNRRAFESALQGCAFACLGNTISDQVLRVRGLAGECVIEEKLNNLKDAWQRPMKW